MTAATQSRTGRSALGMFATLIYSVVTALVAFKATPLLLGWLGPARFGAFKAVSEWFAYLPLLEFGLGGALAACLAPAVGRSDRVEICSVMTGGFRAYCRIIPLVLIAGTALAFALPTIPAFRNIGATELRTATLILVLPALWNPFAVFRMLAEARQLLFVVSTLLTLQSLLTTVMLLVAARAGWGLPGQSAAIVLGQLPILVALAWSGFRWQPGALRGPEDEGIKRKIWALNWPTFVFTLSGRLSLLSDNIIVAILLGPAMVGPFYLTQRLPILAQAQLQNIGGATWAGLVELHAQGRVDVFRARFLEISGLTSGLALAVLGPIAAFNQSFVVRWVGAGNYAGMAVTWLSCFNVWLGALFCFWSWPISGTGNIRAWVPFATAFAAVNVIVSLGATAWFGMPGPLIGTTVGFLAVTAWALPGVVSRLFSIGPRELWAVSLRPLAWGVPYTIFVWAVVPVSMPADLLRVAAGTGMAVLGGVLCWWSFGLTVDSRARWIGRMRLAFGI